MKYEQLLNLAEVAISAEKTSDYRRYNLVIYKKHLVCYPSIHVPKDATRIFSFLGGKKKNGFSPAEWNSLAVLLVEADQKGLLCQPPQKP